MESKFIFNLKPIRKIIYKHYELLYKMKLVSKDTLDLKKYKLGLSEEGKDYFSCGFYPECEFCKRNIDISLIAEDPSLRYLLKEEPCILDERR